MYKRIVQTDKTRSIKSFANKANGVCSNPEVCFILDYNELCFILKKQLDIEP